jgi:putative transposase
MEGFLRKYNDQCVILQRKEKRAILLLVLDIVIPKGGTAPMENVAEVLDVGKYWEERWQDVKDDFWGDLKTHTVKALKRFLETNTEIQVQDLIRAGYWEHNGYRRGYRNGYYYRNFDTSMGEIYDLRMPRVRNVSVEYAVIPRYKRRAKDVDQMILKMFLAGVSTRRVKEVLEPILGKNKVSAQTVSTISKQLNKMVRAYHNRRLTDRYKYLFFDGIYVKAKSPHRSTSRCILVCYGITLDDKKDLVDFEITGLGESENAWVKFIGKLYHRGLTGDNLRLIVSDGNKGLLNSLGYLYPFVMIQRCWVHKLRNVSKKLPKKYHDECISEARKIYLSRNQREALSVFKAWARKWRDIVPKAVKSIEDDYENLVGFLNEPAKYHVKIRTTNAIERVFREVRRRIRPMNCFENRDSVDRIIFSVFNRFNDIWENGSHFEITQSS